MKKIFLCCLIFMSINLIYAQWTKTNGPEGGFIHALYYDNSKIFAGSHGLRGGALISTDEGESWNLSNTGLTETGIMGFAVVESNIIAGTWAGGAFRSEDDGMTWSAINNGLTNTNIQSLVSIGTNIYAGTYGGGVFFSADYGDNWTTVNTGLTNLFIYSMVIIGTNIFVGTDGGGVFLSTDYGANWSAVNNGIPTEKQIITCFTAMGDDIYAGGISVFRSTDNGTSWTEVNTGLPYNAVIEMTVRDTLLFAGTDSRGGIYRSTNRGSTWTAVNTGLWNGSIRSLIAVGSKIYAGTDGGGIYLSTNNGDNWSSINNGVYGSDVRALALKGSNLYAGIWGNGVFTSTDKGNSWSAVNTGITNHWVFTLVIKDTIIFIGTHGGGVFRSIDNGNNWSAVNAGLTNSYVHTLEVSGNNLFAGTEGGGVFLSPDNGMTWNAVNSGLTWPFILSLESNGSTIYAGTVDSGVYISTDNGANWGSIKIGAPNESINTLVLNGSTLIAGTHGSGIFRSTNHGADWIPTSSGAGGIVGCFYVMNAAIFSGGYGHTSLSVDDGQNWTNITTQEWGMSATSFAVIDTVIYAGMVGVWRRPISEMLPYGAVSGIVFNDINSDGIRDIGDTGIVGWKVYLKDNANVLIDSAITGNGGSFYFEINTDGIYSVSEYLESGWLQTYPSGLGVYTDTINRFNYLVNKDFGNTYGYQYVGSGDGNWSDSSNWAGGSPPGPASPAVIPSGVTVTIDSLLADTILALRITDGGTLRFTPEISRLKVIKSVQIDPGAVLEFPETSDTTGIICFKDWVNRGTFEPGHSVITFAGDEQKYIASDSSSSKFYTLEIAGDSTHTTGNIITQNKIILQNAFTLREQDTLFVESEDTNAVEDVGIVRSGTIRRRIASAETGNYRFESPDTYIKFSGEGTNPSSVYMTVLPQEDLGNFYWDSLKGIVDTVKNTIQVDSVKEFSKWPFGIPRPRTATSRADSLFVKIDPAGKLYKINAESGKNYKALLSLWYDQAELMPSIDENELHLFRGPYFADSVSSFWNMVSLPLIAGNNNLSSLYPEAVTKAYSYNGLYAEEESLDFGTGYWLKFPTAQQLIFKGEDCASKVIDVQEGWNLIGSISYPVSVNSVVSFPPGIMVSMFFGYKSGYQMEDSIKPSHAYWIKVSGDGQLILNEAEDGMLSKQLTVEDRLCKLNSLLITDADGNEQCLYYGWETPLGVTGYDLPPTPPEEAFDVRYSSGKMLEVFGKDSADRIIKIRSAEYPLTIKWDVKDKGRIASLDVYDNGLNLIGSGSVSISDPSAVIRLRWNPDISSGVPEEFALEQNYPNPFNPATTIRYQLPFDSRVRINVYNVLGQEVAVLVDEKQEAGFRSIEWNAGNYPTGVYVYRMNAEAGGKTVSFVKKLVLVK